MEIKINDYYEPEHFRAICEDNFSISRTGEYEKNEMHHIHDSCEILLVEEGIVDYYINGKKFELEPNSILVIGSKEYHMRRIKKLPFIRYGLTLKPRFYKSLFIDQDIYKVFSTPKQENFKKYYKNVDEKLFNKLINLLCKLKEEQVKNYDFNSYMQNSIITEITIILFRYFNLERSKEVMTTAQKNILDIKEYIDNNYYENLDLKILSEEFYLHPSTISKYFKKYTGYCLNEYINNVRICNAVRLLESTQDSITDIMGKCGYNSINTFLRQFKNKMEISPLQYRKSVKRLYANLTKK
ncbi:AraC family transcriptional regulator [Defluviitalea phaphyphila]|uniref:AraC family transcriptional regulator n=1 Tax=Defluviitalea phaphyphila TaxID=1473580 RepID=UPI0007308BE6|nr:AraC family transcriptional regulator [Defluviitalea phaphyphila]